MGGGSSRFYLQMPIKTKKFDNLNKCCIISKNIADYNKDRNKSAGRFLNVLEVFYEKNNYDNCGGACRCYRAYGLLVAK